MKGFHQKKIRGGLKKNLFFKVEITTLMSFKHLKMLNSASKCRKIPLQVIKFSKPEIFLSKKQVDGGGVSPPCQIHAGGKSPPLYETPKWSSNKEEYSLG
jgi:hypothetical protein